MINDNEEGDYINHGGWGPLNFTIPNSDLNRPCFVWHPYGKSGLFKTELVILFSCLLNKGDH